MSVWRRLDNGVDVVSIIRPRGAHRQHRATLDDVVVGTFASRPGGRGCSGTPAIDATIAGLKVTCAGVREWIELLDLVPAQLLVQQRPPRRPTSQRPVVLARRAPQTQRFRERVRAAARASVLRHAADLRDRDAAELALRRAWHEHPIAVALRVGLTVDEQDPAPAPPTALDRRAQARRLALGAGNVFGTDAEILATLDAVEQLVPVDATAIDLVVALLYDQAGIPLVWDQGQLFTATV